MLNLNIKGVEVFINRYNNLMQDSFWNNYDLILWKKDASGFYDTNGSFHKNNWGIIEKFSINNNGNWRLPKHYVKYFK